MRIAINTRFLLTSKMEGFGWYTFEVVKRMVEQHPEHEFLFFFDRPFDEQFIFGKNVTPIVLRPPARHPILFRIWFDFSVTRALTKYKADVFFSPDGYASLRSGVPQVGVIHDLNFEHYPQDIPWQPRLYLRKFFPKFANRFTKIITVSAYSKQDICETYNIPEEKVTVGWNGASEAFKPLGALVKAETEQAYAKGKSYFIFVGALHPRKNVGRLLAAFGDFCKKNETIDLVIVGENLWKNKSVPVANSDEETKNRVHFTGHVTLSQLTELMSSAYALVYVPYFEGFGIPLAEAMKCGIPIISGNLTSLPEVAGDAALYCDPFSTDAISAKMVELSQNRELCEELKLKSIERGKLFSWDHTAVVCWNVIQSVFPSQQT